MQKKYRGIYTEYRKKELVQAFVQFLDSDHKIFVAEYKGEKLNSLIGFQDELRHTTLPFKIILKAIKVKLIQGPVFRILRMLNGGEFKNRAYRCFGVKIGKDVFIAPDVYIDDMLPELITIEDGCIIGEHSTILAHEFTIRHVRLGRVRIGKQVVVGAYSIIRSGVTIGDRAVIAMDSLVNKDVPSKDEVGGIPEHEIKRLRKMI